MRLGVFSSMAALLASSGLAWAQVPGAPAPAHAMPTMQAAPAPAAPAVNLGAPPGPAPAYLSDPSAFTHTSLGSGCASCGGHDGDGHNNGDGSLFNEDPGTPHRIFGKAEYLLWRIKDTGVPTFTNSFGAGYLSVPVSNQFISSANGAGSTVNQSVTLPSMLSSSQNQGSPNNVQFGDQPGMRFDVGYWLDSEETFGIEASYFKLWRKTNTFFNSAVSPSQALGTGFQDQVTIVVNSFVSTSSTPSQVALSAPVFLAANSVTTLLGTISSETWGMEYSARCRVCSFGCLKIDAIGGVRYMEVDERLNASENLSVAGTIPNNQTGTQPVTTTTGGASNNPVTTTVLNNGVPGLQPFQGTITDFINVRNQFYGGQVGFNFEWRAIGKLYVDGFTKLAIGDMHETFDLRGFTQQVIPDAARPNNPGIATTAGGSFVSPLDNNTKRTFDRIAVIPQVNFNIGYEVVDNVRVHIGYDYLYISALARPIDQLTTSPSTLATVVGGSTGNGGSSTLQVNSPAFHVHNDKSWIYGINVGIDLAY